MFRLDGKVALVTGGGSGLGRGMVEALIAGGAERVYIVSRKAARLEQVAREIDPDGRCVPFAADLTRADEMHRVAGEIAAREGRLHVLVNNSGAGWVAGFDDYPEKGWDKVFQLNLKAPFFLVQALASLLAKAGTPDDPARVINIGSIAGDLAKGSQTFAYGLSKGALHHATRMLAYELGPRHIAVNAVAPGRFETSMTAHIASDPERHAREAAMTALGRWGKVSELGGIVAFLATPASAYITGTVIAVDGGMMLEHPLELAEE